MAPFGLGAVGAGLVLLHRTAIPALADLVPPEVLELGRLRAAEQVRMLALSSLLGTLAVLLTMWVRSGSRKPWMATGAVIGYAVHTVLVLLMASHMQSIIGEAQGVLDWFGLMLFDAPSFHAATAISAVCAAPLKMVSGASVIGLVVFGVVGGMQWALIGAATGGLTSLGLSLWLRHRAQGTGPA